MQSVTVRTQTHPKIPTRSDSEGKATGYLVPIYNQREGFFAPGEEPQQVYLTAIAPRAIKGPHLHFKRAGFFTCIRGNIRVVVKVDGGYQQFYSGENHGYCSIQVPKSMPAALQNLGDEDALVLNMPAPAWAPDMDDEHTADFGDFDFHA